MLFNLQVFSLFFSVLSTKPFLFYFINKWKQNLSSENGVEKQWTAYSTTSCKAIYKISGKNSLTVFSLTKMLHKTWGYHQSLEGRHFRPVSAFMVLSTWSPCTCWTRVASSELVCTLPECLYFLWKETTARRRRESLWVSLQPLEDKKLTILPTTSRWRSVRTCAVTGNKLR